MISIQTMFRSGGTYIFDKMKRVPGVYPYFEPCSEFLAARSAAAIAELMAGTRPHLRHSGEPAPFHFYPFRPTGGVEGFQRRFAFERYRLPPDHADPELADYVRGLCEYAAARLRRPLAKWCRMGLRACWLDRTTPSLTLYVVRNPASMFRSYWSFDGARSYLFTALVLIIANNRDDPCFRDAADEFGIPSFSAVPAPRHVVEARRVAERLGPAALRDLLLLLWVLTLLENTLIAKAIIDIDLLGESVDYRAASAARIEEATGLAVRFDDVRRSALRPAPGEAASSRGVGLAAAAVRRAGYGAVSPTWALSRASAAVLERVLES